MQFFKPYCFCYPWMKISVLSNQCIIQVLRLIWKCLYGLFMCIWGRSARKAITRHVASEEQITVYCHFMALWETQKMLTAPWRLGFQKLRSTSGGFQMVAISFPITGGEESWLGRCLTWLSQLFADCELSYAVSSTAIISIKGCKRKGLK